MAETQSRSLHLMAVRADIETALQNWQLRHISLE
jgi:hypothetical protein